MSSTKKEGISMIQIDWKFRHQRHREVIGGLQNFYAELDSIKDTKMVITELQTQIGNLCDYCRELEELINQLCGLDEKGVCSMKSLSVHKEQKKEERNDAWQKNQT